MRLARATLDAYGRRAPAPAPPAAAGAALRRGAFVTLTVRDDGSLRGCIGHIAADLPLGEVVRRMTIAAARDDPRFPPVDVEEIPALHIEISVLTLPARARAPVDPGRVVVGRDGLLIRRGARAGLLLPQVAVEAEWTATAFLAATCRKAGLAPDAWREPATEVLLFQADVFGEEDRFVVQDFEQQDG